MVWDGMEFIEEGKVVRMPKRHSLRAEGGKEVKCLAFVTSVHDGVEE
jgi:hypothetical protein